VLTRALSTRPARLIGQQEAKLFMKIHVIHKVIHENLLLERDGQPVYLLPRLESLESISESLVIRDVFLSIEASINPWKFGVMISLLKFNEEL